MNTRTHALAVSSAAAVIAAGLMLALGILGNMGLYTGAVEMMRQWHMFFNAGMIEGAVITFIVVYLFVWLEQKFLSKVGK
jgi:hypothetical protein